VRKALADPDPKLREAGVAAFGQWGRADADVQDQLLALLDDANDGVKLRTVSVLSRLAGDGEEVVAALTHRLTADDSDKVKAEAARALGQIGPPAASAGPALLRAVRTGGAEVREEAMRAVVHIEPPEMAEALTAGLHDAEPGVRVLASAGWRKAADIPEEAVPALIEALHDPEVQVRANAAYAVGRMDPVPTEAVPLLAECLTVDDAGLRLNAAVALQAATGRAAADALRPLLQDANPRLRLIAARRELAEEPTDAAAADVITGVFADPSPYVRQAAEQLLAS
jgi:HEAT repeat protein